MAVSLLLLCSGFATPTAAIQRRPPRVRAEAAKRSSSPSHARRRRTYGWTRRRHDSEAVLLAEPPRTVLAAPSLLMDRGSQPYQADELSLSRRARRMAAIRPSETLTFLQLDAGIAQLEAARIDVKLGAASTRERGMTTTLSGGLRVQFMSVGLRFSHVPLSGGGLSTSGVLVGLRVPLGRFEPFLAGMAGYAWEGGVTDHDRASVKGFTGGGQAGIACFLTHYIALNATLDISYVALTATDISVDVASQRSVDHAREQIERTGYGRLRSLSIGISGHL